MADGWKYEIRYVGTSQFRISWNSVQWIKVLNSRRQTDAILENIVFWSWLGSGMSDFREIFFMHVVMIKVEMWGARGMKIIRAEGLAVAKYSTVVGRKFISVNIFLTPPPCRQCELGRGFYAMMSPTSAFILHDSTISCLSSQPARQHTCFNKDIAGRKCSSLFPL